MTMIPEPDLERLGKFMRLLASDIVGERAAAAKKATELLATHSLDWHAVFAAISRAPAPRETVGDHMRQSPYARHASAARRSFFDEASPFDWEGFEHWSQSARKTEQEWRDEMTGTWTASESKLDHVGHAQYCMSSGVAWTTEETSFLNRMMVTVSPTLYDREHLKVMRQRVLSEKLYRKG